MSDAQTVNAASEDRAGARVGQVVTPERGQRRKPFEAALLHAIAAAEAGGRRYTLVRIAEKVLVLAAKGNIEAIKVLADRLDGRPQQAIDLTAHRVDPLHGAQADDLAAAFIEARRRAQEGSAGLPVLDVQAQPEGGTEVGFLAEEASVIGKTP